MKVAAGSRIPEILRQHESELVAEWSAELERSGDRSDLIRTDEVRRQAVELLRLLADATARGGYEDVTSQEWRPVREFLNDITRSRVHQGFTPSQVATFVLSFKQPLFAKLRDKIGVGSGELVDEIWRANLLLDKLGLWVTEIYQKNREEVIQRQQQELLELSTPVVKLWDKILGLPMIGTLDSARTQIVMESLLEKIVQTGSQVAIIDITGVPTVDTLVAQHLLKTVAAARLMGTEVIISGVRPQIAQTIVQLGVDLGTVITKANLADAFGLALRRRGLKICSDRSARVERLERPGPKPE